MASTSDKNYCLIFCWPMKLINNYTIMAFLSFCRISKYFMVWESNNMSFKKFVITNSGIKFCDTFNISIMNYNQFPREIERTELNKLM